MLKTKYITLDDIKNYLGEDLRLALGSEESAIAFVVRIENRLETFIDANFNRSIEREYPCFSDYQKKHYKQALLEQVIYIYKNSDISVDSGYDIDKGEIISRAKIKQLSIAPNTRDELILCGLWNRQIRYNRRNILWWIR